MGNYLAAAGRNLLQPTRREIEESQPCRKAEFAMHGCRFQAKGRVKGWQKDGITNEQMGEKKEETNFSLLVFSAVVNIEKSNLGAASPPPVGLMRMRCKSALGGGVCRAFLNDPDGDPTGNQNKARGPLWADSAPHLLATHRISR